jgi:hypothetical protein
MANKLINYEELSAQLKAAKEEHLAAKRARRQAAKADAFAAERERWRAALAYAVAAADGWCDDASGGPVPGERMAEVRRMLAGD